MTKMTKSTKTKSKSKKKSNEFNRLFASKKVRQLVLPLLGIVLVLGAFLLVKIMLSSDNTGSNANDPKAQQAYKEELKSKVDTSNGQPQSGRDPSSQQQTGLSDAASKPSGTGTRTDTPASGVTGSNDTHNTSSDVYGDPSKTGVNSAGCYIDYGVQGQECLPTHAATNGTMTCADVRNHGFPDGIKVTGTDRLKLDTNGDKIACNAGD